MVSKGGYVRILLKKSILNGFEVNTTNTMINTYKGKARARVPTKESRREELITCGYCY